MYKGSLQFLFLLLAGTPLAAQNINAPYSTYGIGDIDNRYYDKSTGMANTSMGILSSPYHILYKNPASMAGLERSNVLVNASFVAKSVQFTGDPINVNNASNRDFAIKNFSLAVKLNKHWASGISISPHSYVNYSYRDKLTVEGSTDTYNALYEGDGGLYNVSWNNAVLLNKNFSIGVRSTFLFGSINQSEILDGEILAATITTKKTDYFHTFRFEYGALYQARLNKNLRLGVGGKFAAKTTMNSEQSLLVTEGDTKIREDDFVKKGRFTLPTTYDVGIALTSKGRTTYAVDYTFENWDQLKTKGQTWSLINSHRLSAGIQISNQVEQWQMKFEKSYFQAGVFMNRSYLRIRNTPIDELGVTLGYGSYMTSRLAYGISMEVGRRGTTDKSLIRENYVQATLRLSYREFLFSKGRKYD